MKKLKSSIKTEIRKDLKDYAKMQDIAEKSKKIAVIGKELSMGLALEKQENENVRFKEQIKSEKQRQKNETERLKLDKERFKFEKDLRKCQMEQEKMKFEHEKEIEEKRLELEIKKAESEQFERNAKTAEEKRHNRNQTIIAIIGVAVPALITITSKVIYAKLAFNAQKHDYQDYVMESKYSKEQRDNLNK